MVVLCMTPFPSNRTLVDIDDFMHYEIRYGHLTPLDAGDRALNQNNLQETDNVRHNP
jgi:PleD family two-component response regulator